MIGDLIRIIHVHKLLFWCVPLRKSHSSYTLQPCKVTHFKFWTLLNLWTVRPIYPDPSIRRTVLLKSTKVAITNRLMCSGSGILNLKLYQLLRSFKLSTCTQSFTVIYKLDLALGFLSRACPYLTHYGMQLNLHVPFHGQSSCSSVTFTPASAGQFTCTTGSSTCSYCLLLTYF